jgi:SAM-dependent methyltransferase
LPLAAHGVTVHGIDASTAMLEQLHGKPGGAGITTTLGDIADVDAPGQYDLIYIVFNTLYAMGTQERQVQCLRNAATRLRPGGRFVVEAFVPDQARFDRRPSGAARRVDESQTVLAVTSHDPVSQTVKIRQVLLTRTGVRVLPARLRYAFPSEVDLMARLAGLRRVARFADWDRSPFTATSFSHVSVYASTPTGSDTSPSASSV